MTVQSPSQAPPSTSARNNHYFFAVVVATPSCTSRTFTVTLPAGDYQYKVAINGSWDENYGAGGTANGDNIALSLAEETEVTFSYDDSTHLVTDSVNNP